MKRKQGHGIFTLRDRHVIIAIIHGGNNQEGKAEEMVTEEIKSAVLRAAKIEKIDSPGCFRLAILIHEKTNKRVSVTTLKRVYGLVNSASKTSAYTLAVMAEYSGCFDVKRTLARKKIITEIKPIKDLWTFSPSRCTR